MTDAGADEGADAGQPDLTRVLAEINQEVERRRATGELPPELERELDRTFAEFAPVDAIDADFDSIVAKIERSAVIDIHPSTVSAYPGAAQMKQFVTKATAFYLRHVATQASGLFQALARALRLLGERVEQLEAERGGGDGAPWAELAAQAEAQMPMSTDITVTWGDFVLKELGSPGGRVLHAHAADGRLVRRLVDAGLDAYGVEPSEEAALAASDLVPDIRAVPAADHLRTLPEGALDGLVLSGFVERLALPSLVGLAQLAASRLAPGGVLVVVSVHPGAWLRSGPPLAVDLAEGRPVHPETWQALLGTAGFVDLTAQLEARPEMAEVRTDGWPDDGNLGALAAACRDNFARLGQAVLGPAEFAVSARRPR
ncbi:MAG: class I SAM-dependent methyltransferase [Actinomycetota bacterium]|nr:class I SAM-dependent methyltransferase [Actinomycetota bacterium]